MTLINTLQSGNPERGGNNAVTLNLKLTRDGGVCMSLLWSNGGKSTLPSET